MDPTRESLSCVTATARHYNIQVSLDEPIMAICLAYHHKATSIGLLETAFLNKNLKLKNFKVKKGFLSFYSVCMSSLYRLHCSTLETEILTYIPICEYLKMESFTFFNFSFFSELSLFFVFYYFIYFMPAS